MVIGILKLLITKTAWLLLVAGAVIAIAHLPNGLIEVESNTPSTSTPATPPVRAPGEPLSLLPWEVANPSTMTRVWSGEAYRLAISHYVSELFAGELMYITNPTSYQPHWAPVLPRVWSAYVNSLTLLGAALIFGTCVGVTLGCIAAKLPRIRHAVTGFSIGGLSVPDFYLVLLGQALAVYMFRAFSIRLWSVGVPGGERHWLLPFLALAIPTLGYVIRLTLSATDEILREDFIRVARAKGLPEWRIFAGHALRNAIPRILNGLPTMINVMLSSLVIVELLTSWNGIGNLMIPRWGSQAVITATSGLLFCATFATLDLALGALRLWANPRLKEVAM